MLVSRILFDLQAAHQRTLKVDSNHTLHLGDELSRSMPAFVNRLVGSIGSVIDIRGDEDEDALQVAGDVDRDATRTSDSRLDV